jgi:hypothetical protein
VVGSVKPLAGDDTEDFDQRIHRAMEEHLADSPVEDSEA